MSCSNVSVQNGELVFGGTVASTGGVAKAPVALGKMRRGPAGVGSSNNNNSHAILSHASSTLPARASLKVAPPNFHQKRSSTPSNINNNSNSITNLQNQSRDDSIDVLLAQSRAAAPSPSPLMMMEQNQLRRGSSRNANNNNNLNTTAFTNARASTPHNTSGDNTNYSSLFPPRMPSQNSSYVLNNNTLSPNSSSSPNNNNNNNNGKMPSMSMLAHRAALEPEDFDVATDEAIPLRNKSRAAALDDDAGGAGSDPSSAINNPNNPASRTATASGKPLHVPYAPTIRSRTGVVDVMSPLVLKDYVLLAEACKRAGRARVEATAYFKIAHILSTTDEEEKPKAIVSLRKFLQICRRINDLQGEAKALNALGIIHYEIALATCTPNSKQAEMLLRIALGFHRQHAEIADAAGIFIANTNAGLCHAHLGDHAAAAESHKLAASFAVQAGDRDAEALALSNLAAAATSCGDLATSRLCAQRQLDVGHATHNPGVACEAQEQLAQLAIQRSDFQSATNHLVAALEIALKEGDQRRALRLRCQLGVAQAASGLESRMQDCSSNMESHLQ